MHRIVPDKTQDDLPQRVPDVHLLPNLLQRPDCPDGVQISPVLKLHLHPLVTIIVIVPITRSEVKSLVQ